MIWNDHVCNGQRFYRYDFGQYPLSTPLSCYMPVFVMHNYLRATPGVSFDARQLPPLEHGPERPEERPPHAQHVDWHALYPNEVILKGLPHRREAALTFDDGPDDFWTPRIQAVLNAHGAKGTFLCVGERVQQNPRVLRELVRNGHIIGNHSWSHPNFTKIPVDQVQPQIDETTNLIQRIVGVRPRFFRPPYGALNNEVIREVIALKYKILFWDVDSLDWSGLIAQQVSINVLAHTEPGSIILMHAAGGRGESLEDTVQALPYIIQVLRRHGYQLRTVPELLNTPAYQS